MCVHIYESHCVRVHNGTELRVEVGVLSRQELAQLDSRNCVKGPAQSVFGTHSGGGSGGSWPFRWAQNKSKTKEKSEKRGNENQIQIPNVGEVRTDCLTKKRSDRWALTGPGLPGRRLRRP